MKVTNLHPHFFVNSNSFITSSLIFHVIIKIKSGFNFFKHFFSLIGIFEPGKNLPILWGFLSIIHLTILLSIPT